MRLSTNRVLSAVVTAAAWGLAAAPARALPVTFTGSSGSLSASVTFDLSGSNLLVTLTNTSAADVLVPANLLTAVFFNVAGNPPLTRVSAVVPTGSAVVFGLTDPGNVVGGEWAYKTGIVGVPGGALQGISSSGLGIFGPADNFPGTNLQGPVDVNGMQYGITSAGDNTATGNPAVTGPNALIKNSVLFTLSGLPNGFALSNISNVNFQYGTDLSEPSFPGGSQVPGVPEPGTILLLGGGLAAVSAVSAVRRRRKGNAPEA